MLPAMTWIAKRHHDFCAGHRVVGQGGQCERLHGHNYRVHFECAAWSLDAVGRVIDFGDIKALLCGWLETHWDHRFLVWDEDPLAASLAALDRDGVVRVPFNPTAENMAAHLVREVGPRLLEGTGIRLVAVEVEETRKCAAAYRLG
jgi:6-pyruvoyltetrahydropterin/6-carboxytetrahydropterin synthase